MREGGYRRDIYVYLEVADPDSQGCVASELRKLGVKVRPFGELMPNFEHPKNRSRSPAWYKLGLVWNPKMRKYDRMFFFDTDQFVNMNIQDLVVRELPENVAIAICAQECVK